MSQVDGAPVHADPQEPGAAVGMWLRSATGAQLALVVIATVGQSLLRSRGTIVLLVVAAGFLPLQLHALVRRRVTARAGFAFCLYLSAVIFASALCYRDMRDAQAALACELCVPLFGIVLLGRRGLEALAAVAALLGVVGTVLLGGSALGMTERAAATLAVACIPGLVVARYKEQLVRARREAESARAFAELVSLTDPLTGLANRRGMEKAFNPLWHQACRDGRKVGALVFDIDHFKSVNDRHGHSAGDSVLECVADATRESVRDSDIAVRFGGEEFLVLASVDSPDELTMIAERISAQVAECARNIPVTISLGIAWRDPEPVLRTGQVTESLESVLYALVAEADHRMYAAKSAGRDRIVGPPASAGMLDAASS